VQEDGNLIDTSTQYLDTSVPDLYVSALLARARGQAGRCTGRSASTSRHSRRTGLAAGITFTYGGLRFTPQAGVLSTDGTRIAGLYAIGELTGGTFYVNCPAGGGLTNGAVFGKIAGTTTAAYAAR
jgi:succinate dehydrogenase/fumarate reductase flavoprotein subunit